jgi:hypothetical protein
LVGSWQAVGRQLAGSWQAVGRQLAGKWQAVGRQLAGSWQAVGKQLLSGSFKAVIDCATYEIENSLDTLDPNTN